MTSKTTPAAADSPTRSLAPRGRAGALRLSIMTRAVGQESRGVRRGLQIALGLIWLLDAALQFQPYMYSRSCLQERTGLGRPRHLIASRAVDGQAARPDCARTVSGETIEPSCTSWPGTS
jgi:hypothetical protein